MKACIATNNCENNKTLDFNCFLLLFCNPSIIQRRRLIMLENDGINNMERRWHKDMKIIKELFNNVR